jgi:hypothetical protein
LFQGRIVHTQNLRQNHFFGTANVYGRGAAESVLGEALAGIPRHSYSLAMKVFFPMSDTDRGLSRAQIVKQLDASLKPLWRDQKEGKSYSNDRSSFFRFRRGDRAAKLTLAYLSLGRLF